MRRSYNLIHELLKRLRGKIAQNYYSVLEKFNLLKFETVTKENLLKAYTQIDNIYESHRNQQPKLKHVDFNQGVDCRYITDEYMQLMSEIPIQPLRIAFDSLEIEKEYRKAIGLAAKYGIKELSAYLFYNYQDSPDEFYRRLEINMELCRELDVTIYSFPMKYIPLYGEDAKHREYMGPKWNKKFIRAIQSIINVTKGIVAPPSRNGKSSSFFTKAFGKDLHEFHELLYMPETYIIYRKLFEKELGYTYQWQDLFNSLTEDERAEVIPIIESNTFKDVHLNNQNDKISKLLQHYKITRDDVKKANNEYNVIKNKFNSNIG
jgi:hypothetical protein